MFRIEWADETIATRGGRDRLDRGEEGGGRQTQRERERERAGEGDSDEKRGGLGPLSASQFSPQVATSGQRPPGSRIASDRQPATRQRQLSQRRQRRQPTGLFRFWGSVALALEANGSRRRSQVQAGLPPPIDCRFCSPFSLLLCLLSSRLLGLGSLN